MRTERVDQADDPRLDPFRFVRDPVLVKSRGLFVAEGRRVVTTLLGRWPETLDILVVTPSAREAMAADFEGLDPTTTVYEVPGPSVLKDVTGVRFHQGCLALARRPATKRLADCGDALAPGDRLWLVLEGVTDPDNVGTLFRSAAAFGADGVLLGPGCAHPLYRKALRTSLGTVLVLPFAESEDWAEDLCRLRECEMTSVALTPADGARPLAQAVEDAGGRVALMVGSEERGLGEAALSHAEVKARIPMRREVDSLNAAAAGAIALQAFRARLDLARREEA